VLKKYCQKVYTLKNKVLLLLYYNSDDGIEFDGSQCRAMLYRRKEGRRVHDRMVVRLLAAYNQCIWTLKMRVRL